VDGQATQPAAASNVDLKFAASASSYTIVLVQPATIISKVNIAIRSSKDIIRGAGAKDAGANQGSDVACGCIDFAYCVVVCICKWCITIADMMWDSRGC
jgi:hypothetical protein